MADIDDCYRCNPYGVKEGPLCQTCRLEAEIVEDR